MRKRERQSDRRNDSIESLRCFRFRIIDVNPHTIILRYTQSLSSLAQRDTKVGSIQCAS